MPVPEPEPEQVQEPEPEQETELVQKSVQKPLQELVQESDQELDQAESDQELEQIKSEQINIVEQDDELVIQCKINISSTNKHNNVIELEDSEDEEIFSEPEKKVNLCESDSEIEITKTVPTIESRINEKNRLIAQYLSQIKKMTYEHFDFSPFKKIVELNKKSVK